MLLNEPVVFTVGTIIVAGGGGGAVVDPDDESFLQPFIHKMIAVVIRNRECFVFIVGMY